MDETNNTSEQNREQHEPARSYRDLGSAGGGTIPQTGGGSGEPRGGMSTSNSTVQGGSPAGAVAGAGSPRDRGSVTNTDLNTTSASTGAHNAIDASAQSSIGGRRPDQASTAMGDQDAASTNTLASDPMTSRTPNKMKHDDTQKK